MEVKALITKKKLLYVDTYADMSNETFQRSRNKIATCADVFMDVRMACMNLETRYVISRTFLTRLWQ